MFPIPRSISLILTLFCVKISSAVSTASCRNRSVLPKTNNSVLFKKSFNKKSFITSHIDSIRGGADTDVTNENDNDEERYSRQLYTLGARAHKLVRSTNILLDGPFSSGLTYECAKNLALSGVGGIILVQDDDTNTDSDGETNDQYQRLQLLHEVYHNQKWDDLGNAYRNSARNEISLEHTLKDQLDRMEKKGEKRFDEFLLLEYLSRLNPSLKISIIKRSELVEGTQNRLMGENPVLLCIDRPQSTQVIVNSLCRDLKIPFVSIESRGVYGRAFCDFGDDFFVEDEDGETPKNTLFEKIDRLSNIGDHSNGIANQILKVYCVEGEKHDVSKGDIISFNFVEDENIGKENEQSTALRFKVINVESPTQFTISLTKIDNSCSIESLSVHINDFIERANNLHQTKTFSRVKIPRHIPFLSMKEALRESQKKNNELFAASDLDKSFDETRRAALMASFAVLDEFVKKFNHLPIKKDNQDDISNFQDILESLYHDSNSKFKKITLSFANCAAATLTPVQALMGALGAQEALKAASGLYNPIKQFLLYDCDELLLQNNNNHEVELIDDQVPGQSYILGSYATSVLASQRLFVVGSGAIGCEILKNLSAMGAATGKKGHIFLTDMDTIERSNLSRQLLFRDADVGKFKSSAAEEAILRFNPKISIEAHSNKVGEDATSPFDDLFWSKRVDIVLNALDNVEARLFIDKKCVENRKGMIDAGTLGSKGNMQVVVPMQSESYGSSVDPPEPAIPVCTLKNFPYEISHTIQWGRDLFDGLFNRRPTQANGYWESLHEIGPDELGQSMLEKYGEDVALTTAEEIQEDLWVHLKNDECNHENENFVNVLREASLKWAVNLAERLFEKSVTALLRQHPKDSLDEDGNQFWTGTRKCPKYITYDDVPKERDDPGQISLNQYLVEFIQSAARLRMQSYLPENLHTSCIISSDEAKAALKGTSQRESHSEETHDTEGSSSSVLSEIISKLRHANKNSPNEPNLQVTEFEKDDESNGHVDFVTAASNLRAMIYSIPPTSKMETRRIAGRIVPAMITTTAFVSALSCLEMLKLMLKSPLNLHRNAFVNLALPFFAFTQPLPADEIRGLNDEIYTLWDRIVIKEKKKHVISEIGGNTNDKNGVTMRQFLKLLQKKIGLGNEVTTISYGPYMIYANFLHEDDTSVLDQSMWDLVRETIISGDDIDEVEFDDVFEDEFGDNERKVTKDLTDVQIEGVRKLEKKVFLEFSLVVEEEETGEEVEIPPVRLIKWKGKK